MDLLKEIIENDCLEKVRNIIDNNGLPCLDSNYLDYNLLKRTLRNGQKEIAKLLISSNFRVNKISKLHRECTPLHLAVNLGCEELVELLLAKKACITVKNNNFETPLILAMKMGKYNIVDRILLVITYENPSNNERLSHMHIACMRNHVDVVKRYVQNRVQINHAVDVESDYWPGYTSLHFAVQFQSVETVDFLIKCGAKITAKDNRELTPLHIAHAFRNESIIDLILSAHTYEDRNPENANRLSHFHIACTRNNPKTIEGFLQNKIKINMQVSDNSLNWSGYTPLNFALEYECTNVVKLLLAHNASLELVDSTETLTAQYAYQTANAEIINIVCSKFSMGKYDALTNTKLNDLHVACLKCDIDAVENALDNGIPINSIIDIDSPIFPGYTALHIAVQKNCEDIVTFLLMGNPDITLKDVRGKTALHLAFENGKRNRLSSIINSLIISTYKFTQTNPVDNTGLSHFHIACTTNKLIEIQKFIEKGVDINGSVNPESTFWPDYSPLHFAIKFQDFNKSAEKLTELLLSNGANSAAKNSLGMTPLDLAIQKVSYPSVIYGQFVNVNPDIKIINFLLLFRKFTKTSSFNTRGFSLLHTACAMNDESVIEKFFRDFSDSKTFNGTVDSDSPSWPGYTPLHFAAHFEKNEAIQLLLKHEIVDVSIKDTEGNTPLHIIFERWMSVEIIHPYDEKMYRGLILCPENPFGKNGFSHFHIAGMFNDIQAVQYFLEREIDVNLPINYNSNYAFMGKTLLHIASSEDNFAGTGLKFDLLRLILETGHADVNAKDVMGNTPLHCVSNLTDRLTVTVKMLLDNGADVNAENANKETPMHTFLTKTNVNPKVIEMLLEHGADVNAENANKETPMHTFLTKTNVNPKVIEMLLEHGADVNVTDRGGKTPLMVSGVVPQIALIKHLRRLKIIGLPIDRNNELVLERWLRQSNLDYNDGRFSRHCRKELGRMKKLKISNSLTLYDILLRDVRRMVYLVDNTVLRKSLESPSFEVDFPIYGYLLRLQHKRGLARKFLVEASKVSFSLIFGFKIANSSLEIILSYLSDDDLKNLSCVPRAK